MNKSVSYERFVFPLLSRIDAESAHERTLRALSMAQRWKAGRWLLQRIAGEIPDRKVELFGLTFPNVLGIAAGFDKDVLVVPGLAMLGFGHIETGTITPKPQVGNPKPRIFRLLEDQALINRMGFPSAGLAGTVDRLRALAAEEHTFVIGVSIGKQKETALADAAEDYLEVLAATYPYGDYFAVNISSPNTPELRKLQGREYLNDLLIALKENSRFLAQKNNCPVRPLLIKIAPDLSWAELDDILQATMDQGIDGIIATNTTLAREGLLSAQLNESGGLSGVPLAERSTAVIAHIAQHTEGKLPIIGVGGIRSAEDAQEKMDAGASLVQLYTGLIYEGPGIAGRILRDLHK